MIRLLKNGKTKLLPDPKHAKVNRFELLSKQMFSM